MMWGPTSIGAYFMETTLIRGRLELYGATTYGPRAFKTGNYSNVVMKKDV